MQKNIWCTGVQICAVFLFHYAQKIPFRSLCGVVESLMRPLEEIAGGLSALLTLTLIQFCWWLGHNILTVLTDKHTFISLCLCLHPAYIKCIDIPDVIKQYSDAVYISLNCSSTCSFSQPKILHFSIIIANIHARGSTCVRACVRACVCRQSQSGYQPFSRANGSLDNTAVATHQCCLGCRVKTHRRDAHTQTHTFELAHEHTEISCHDARSRLSSVPAPCSRSPLRFCDGRI